MFLDAGHDAHRSLISERREDCVPESVVDHARIRAAIGDPIRYDDPRAHGLSGFGFIRNASGKMTPRAYTNFNVCGHTAPGEIWRSLRPVHMLGDSPAEGGDRRDATQFSLIASACYGRSRPIESWIEDLAMRDLIVDLRIPGSRRVFAVARCADGRGEKFPGQSTAHFEAAFENARQTNQFARRSKEIADLRGAMSDDRQARLTLRDMLSYGVEDDDNVATDRTRAPRVVIAAPPVGPLGDFFRDDERIILLTLAQHGAMANSKLFAAVANILSEPRGSTTTPPLATRSAQIMAFMRAKLVMQVSNPTPPRRFRLTLTPRGRRAALFI